MKHDTRTAKLGQFDLRLLAVSRGKLNFASWKTVGKASNDGIQESRPRVL